VPTSKFEAATRAGFAARGIMYILIGYLALKSGNSRGNGGALEYLNSGNGKILLAGMAIGFLAYGLWRISEAALDSAGQGSDRKGMAKRGAGLLSGLIHLGLAFYAARLASGGGGGGSDGAEKGAAAALSLPGGQTLLTVAAIILLVGGIYQFVNAAKLGFLRHLDQRAAREAWVRWAGRLGYAARGLVFLVMAYFLLNAARGDNAQRAGGTGDALGSLPPSVQTFVAAGLLLFGLFSLVEARFRRIAPPEWAT